jgi:hypothetical protein
VREEAERLSAQRNLTITVLENELNNCRQQVISFEAWSASRTKQNLWDSIDRARRLSSPWTHASFDKTAMHREIWGCCSPCHDEAAEDLLFQKDELTRKTFFFVAQSRETTQKLERRNKESQKTIDTLKKVGWSVDCLASARTCNQISEVETLSDRFQELESCEKRQLGSSSMARDWEKAWRDEKAVTEGMR